MSNISGLHRKINDIPLNYKFLLIYLLCVLVPIVTINILFFNQVSRNIQVREVNNLKISMDRSAKELMSLIEGGIALSHSLSTDRNLYENLDRKYEDSVHFYEAFDSVLREKMKPFLSAYPYVDDISIYTDNDTIEGGTNYHILTNEVIHSAWYQELMANQHKVFVISNQAPDTLNPYVTKEYFSIIRTLDEFSVFNTYHKYLKIDINLNKIQDILDREKPYLILKLVDAEGHYISQAITASPDNGDHPIKGHADANTKQHLIFDKDLGNANFIQGWKIIGIADKQRMNTALHQSRNFIWMLAIISTFVPTTLIFVVLRSYNYRIKRLSRHMEKVKNEKFDLLVVQEGKDEIGGLIRSFNLMTSKINSLINDVYKLEIQKKDLQLEQVRAELNLLQSQMDPHFLFNTLNALLVVSVKNNYSEVTDIIRNLSLILRRMLNWSNDTISLEEELKFTEMYLKIEKFRFADRFDYSFSVDKTVLAYQVPRMCIQPLVENACKHGLQAVKELRRIQIRVGLLDQFLVVEIEDNGIGIDWQQLNNIIDQLHENQDTGVTIGLRNVYKRLKFNFNDRVDFRIESEPGIGTKVWYKIPVKLLIC